ncbi:MAG: hypothetical protein U0525_05385 [Patescibacteria group bacterium]
MKSNITPLTLADTEINQLVIDSINKKYPSHGIIGEEGNGGAEAQNMNGYVIQSMALCHILLVFPIHFSLALYQNKKPVFWYFVQSNAKYIFGGI